MHLSKVPAHHPHEQARVVLQGNARRDGSVPTRYCTGRYWLCWQYALCAESRRFEFPAARVGAGAPPKPPHPRLRERPRGRGGYPSPLDASRRSRRLLEKAIGVTTASFHCPCPANCCHDQPFLRMGWIIVGKVWSRWFCRRSKHPISGEDYSDLGFRRELARFSTRFDRNHSLHSSRGIGRSSAGEKSGFCQLLRHLGPVNACGHWKDSGEVSWPAQSAPSRPRSPRSSCARRPSCQSRAAWRLTSALLQLFDQHRLRESREWLPSNWRTRPGLACQPRSCQDCRPRSD